MPKVHLKTAWMVFDDGKLADILTAPKTFEETVEYAKGLYRATRMNFTEKALLAHFNSGSTVRAAAFEGLSIETHYDSDLYRQLQATEERLEVGVAKHRLFAKRFADGPQYVIVGTDVTLEIRRATNVEINTGTGGENVAWDEPTEEGGVRRHRFVSGQVDEVA